jgi:hypothetical protein
VSFRACASFNGVLSSAGQYGEDLGDEGCGDPGYISLAADGVDATLPGIVTQGFFDSLSRAQMLLGAALPAAAIDTIRDEVGLPFIVEARLQSGPQLVRAIKRVLIRAQAGTHRNPPPPSFMLGDQHVVPDTSGEMRCRNFTADRPLVAAAGAEVMVRPVIDGIEEPWLSDYQVIDARGDLVVRHEQAFYSWFASAGDFDEHVTTAPARKNIWHTPDAPSCAGLWLVIRDGQGGVSACGADVTIGSGSCGQ